MYIQDYETAMWEAARQRSSEAFLRVVSSDAVMICGGMRCTGAVYATFISDFDIAGYRITGFETVYESETVCQVHYVVETRVSDVHNKDLAGTFHITSTWDLTGETPKLVFNMDSRITR